MLLLEFGMLRQALVRDQIRLYAAQSALISVLAIVIAADRNLPDLYVLAALSAALKVVAVPLVHAAAARPDRPRRGGGGTGRRGQPDAEPGRPRCWPGSCSPRSGSSAPAPWASTAPPLRSSRWPWPPAMVLVAFVLMIVRRDVASQAIGFFSLENAISLAALVVAAGLPLILEIAFLFDLLVAVVVFGMLIRSHHTTGRIAVHHRPDQAAGVSRCSA